MGDTSENAAAPIPSNDDGETPPAVSSSPSMVSSTPVGVHVYDLSQGFVAKHSKALVGTKCGGLYHSSLIAYGYEYFFEGGIGRAVSGRTRFGTKYAYHAVGVTDWPLEKFERWRQWAEAKKYTIAHYRVVSHNCHNFTCDALQVLCNDPKASLPAYVLSETTMLIDSAVGKCVAPLFERITGGYQYVVSRNMARHDVARRRAEDRAAALMTHTALATPPPRSFILFTSPATPSDTGTAPSRTPNYDADPVHMQLLSQVWGEAMDGGVADTIDPIVDFLKLPPHQLQDVSVVTPVIEALITMLACLPAWESTPAIDLWRVLALRPPFLAVAVFQHQLNAALLHSLKDITTEVPPSLYSLAVLQTACNYFSSPYGAGLLLNRANLDVVIAAIGHCLLPVYSIEVQAAAACLAANVMLAAEVIVRGPLLHEMARSAHPIHRLQNIVMYHADKATAVDVAAPLLLALYRVCLLGTETTVAMRAFVFDWSGLRERFANSPDVVHLIDILCTMARRA